MEKVFGACACVWLLDVDVDVGVADVGVANVGVADVGKCTHACMCCSLHAACMQQCRALSLSIYIYIPLPLPLGSFTLFGHKLPQFVMNLLMCTVCMVVHGSMLVVHSIYNLIMELAARIQN